jgi:hypothetical protein
MMRLHKGTMAIVLLFSATSLFAAPRPSPTPHAVAPKGSHFDSIGRIYLHAGQPCSSQIMFDFRGKTVIWMAAPKHETSILTEAARHKLRVHVSGVWRHGASAGCSFVEVTHAVSEKKFLGIF